MSSDVIEFDLEKARVAAPAQQKPPLVDPAAIVNDVTDLKTAPLYASLLFAFASEEPEVTGVYLTDFRGKSEVKLSEVFEKAFDGKRFGGIFDDDYRKLPAERIVEGFAQAFGKVVKYRICDSVETAFKDRETRDQPAIVKVRAGGEVPREVTVKYPFKKGDAPAFEVNLTARLLWIVARNGAVFFGEDGRESRFGETGEALWACYSL